MKMDLNGLSRYCFIILKDTLGCCFGRTFRQLCMDENQVCVRIKLLSVTSGPIMFDSFYFFPLLSLRVLIFTHLFNTSKNQNYEGLLPPATRFITTVCVTTNDENLRPGSMIKFDGMRTLIYFKKWQIIASQRSIS